MSQYTDIINYWFEGNKFRKFWFKKNKNVDDYIKKRFGFLIKKAENNQLNDWRINPKSSIALVILLDQFSRNIYRNDIEKIKKNDELCLKLCNEIIDKGFDNELSFSQKIFLLLPFRHSKEIYNVYYCIQKIIEYKI